MFTKVSLVVGLLLASAGVCEAQQKIAEWDPNPGASAYGLESSNSADGKTNWSAFGEVQVPLANCTATRCVFTVTPPMGVTKYRVVTYFGTLRVPRLDAGFYSCVGVQSECPLAASGAGFR